MSTNPARFIIVIALAVAGVLVIGNAFQDGTTTAAEDGAEPTATASPTAEPDKGKNEQPKPDEPAKPEGTVEGVRIQVFNATDVTGLAAEVEGKLENKLAIPAGEAGNALENEPVTLVFFRDKQDQTNAEFIADRFFTKAEVGPIADMPDVSLEVSKDAQVVIVVGEADAE